MIELQCFESADKDWNLRLLECPGGTIYQTKEFAQFKKQVFDAENKFLTFVDSKGEIIAQLLCSLQPFLNRTLKQKLLMNFRTKNFYTWVYGPVIFKKEYSSQIEKLLFNFFKNEKTIVKGIAHPFFPSIFKSSNAFNTKPWGTFILDLNQDEEQLLNSTHKNSVKKNITRSIQRGVTIEKINSKNLSIYNSILHKTKLKVGSESDFDKLKIQWNTLKPVGYHGFLAYKDDVPLGGIAFSSFNHYIDEWGIARTLIDKQENLYSQDLLKWSIIKWGLQNKYKYYDFQGVNPHPNDKKEQGIFNYKKKWGGKFFNYPIVSI